MNTTKTVTVSGAIRKRLSEIEQRMYEGERQAAIVASLNAEGIKVSLKDFRQALYRAKKTRQAMLEKQQNLIVAASEIRTDNQQPIESKTGQKKQRKISKNSLPEPTPKLPEKPAPKMSVTDIEDMLKNPLDLDSL